MTARAPNRRILLGDHRSPNFDFPREGSRTGSEMLATRYEVPPNGKTPLVGRS